MKFKFNNTSIAAKVSLIVVATTFLLVGVLITYSVFVLRDREMESARKNAISFSKDYCGRLKSIIEVPLDGSRAIASALLATRDETLKAELSRKDVNAMLKSFLQANPMILGTYTCWQPNAFDGLDSLYRKKPLHDETGRFIPYWFRVNGEIACEALMDYEVEGKGDYYLLAKRSGMETIINPYLYPIAGKEVLMMSMVTPISKSGRFLGITGVDVGLDWLQNMIDQDKDQAFAGKGSLYIISHNGTIVAATGKPHLVGKNATTEFPTYHNVAQETNDVSIVEEGMLKVFVSLYIGNSKDPWKVAVMVPVDYLTAHAEKEMVKMIVISIVFLAVFTVIVLLNLKKLIKPISDIALVAEEVALGRLNISDVKADSAEIEKLNQAFLKVVDSQRDITDVCSSIAKGDFSRKAIVKSEADLLAQSVNQMCINLEKAAEDDYRRNWAAEGLAKFAEVLRADKDLKLLTNSVISNLVKYVKANQGGFFIAERNHVNQVELNLYASYAYERKKFLEKTVMPGEGLIGQCYLEKDIIFMKDIPPSYVKITSGLGDATPTTLLILPLISNNEVEGIIEIASFEIFAEYEIEFMKKVAESIASTLSTVKVNQRTRELLQQSQQQAEELKAQEEEMRQNLEEISATQEEMQRKERAYTQRIAELEELTSQSRG